MIDLPETRWPNQVRAFTGLIDAYNRGVKRLCITSPTGTGKSFCMFDAIRWAKSENLSAVLYTNRRLLFEQLARNLEREGIDFGYRASGYDEALLRDIQLAMIQSEVASLKKESRQLHPANLVLVDERHQFNGETHLSILEQHVAAGAMVVGYTATPLDLEGVDELLVAGTPSESRAIGALVAPNTFAPDEPDLRHIRKYQVGEDLSEPDNAKAIMRPGVFARVVKAWQTHNPEQRPTILFGPDVKGSLYFAEQFWKAGIPTAHIDGEDVWINGEMLASDRSSRDLVAEASRTGQIKVTCCRFVLREGIDWPWVSCMVFATVFGALTSYLQAGGRGLRAFPGKDLCCILDHGGNWHRHGSLAEDRTWELGLTNHVAVSERQRQHREHEKAEPITCPNCGKVRSTGPVCPACGHRAVKRARVVVQIDGTLRAVTGEVYKPRRRRRQQDTVYKWTRMYHRAKSQKWSATFNQAEAMFFREEHYWPPKNLPLMPVDKADWYRKVSAVPTEALIAK